MKTFDELTVRLSLDSSNLQHRKLVFQLVKPYVPGFSYVQETEIEDETEQPDSKKRKENPAAVRKGSKKKSKKK